MGILNPTNTETTEMGNVDRNVGFKSAAIASAQFINPARMAHMSIKFKEEQENIRIKAQSSSKLKWIHMAKTLKEKRESKISESPLTSSQYYQILATSCAASFKCFCHQPAQRGIAVVLNVGSLLLRKGISRSVLTPNKETPEENRTDDNQRAGVSSETRADERATRSSERRRNAGQRAETEGLDLLSKAKKMLQDEVVQFVKDCASLRALIDQKDDQIKKLEEENAILKGRCTEHNDLLRKKEIDHQDLLRKKEIDHQDLLRKNEIGHQYVLRKKDAEMQEFKDGLSGLSKQLQEVIGRIPMPAGHTSGKERLCALEKHAQRSTTERKGKKRTANETTDELSTESQRSKKARQVDNSQWQGSVEPSDEEEDEEQESTASFSSGGCPEMDTSQDSAI